VNILGISGSPNNNGNTVYAVNYALSILKKEGNLTSFISLANKKINPCRGCWQCIENRKCFQNDDFDEIVATLRWCDGLIIGSPVYFGMVTGQLKIMMDRCVVLRPKYGEPIEMSGKIGCGIACGGFRNGGQELTLQNIQTFLLQHNMKTISDGPSFSHSGGTIVGSAADDELGLQTIKNMMLNMIFMLKTRIGQ
jgi:multimeric flavodoxin WrbA